MQNSIYYAHTRSNLALCFQSQLRLLGLPNSSLCFQYALLLQLGELFARTLRLWSIIESGQWISSKIKDRADSCLYSCPLSFHDSTSFDLTHGFRRRLSGAALSICFL